MSLLPSKSLLKLMLLFLAVFAAQGYGKAAKNPQDDVLGEIVPDNDNITAPADEGHTPEGWMPTLPFTEEQERRKAELE